MTTTNIPVSIGIDVGKKELVTCSRCSNGITLPPASFPNTMIGVRQFINKLKAESVSYITPILLESTGPYHWLAAHAIAKHNYAVRVVNPLHSKQIARLSVRKRKTDKIDAGQLAFLASQGYGYPFCETEEMARKKALVRHWWKLKETATNQKQHEQYLKTFRGITKYGIGNLVERRCKNLKKIIISEFKTGNDLKYLDSIPGITPFLGASLLAELRPLDRFTDLGQVIAYAGLDPSVKQSGGKAARFGRMSKRGSSTLRKTLYLAAFGSFMRPPFKTIYDKNKERGLHHTTNLCIISRKILRTAVTLLKKRKEFDAQYVK